MIERLKMVWFMAVFTVIRLLEPIVCIRFGALFVSRLGHLAQNTECYLCEKDAGINRPKRVIDIWTPYGKPANEYLFKMYSRVITTWPSALVIPQLASNWEWFQTKHIFNDSQWGRDIHNLMEGSPPHLKFTRAEERNGQRGLRALGIPEGAKWVCLVVRDSAYLRKAAPQINFDYHDYRNTNPDDYRKAAATLIERGYYVIRMGAEVEAPVRLSSAKFIDYPLTGLRSEFMDVYLGAKCEFCISNSTGFDAIPMVFRRPILYVNDMPLANLSTWAKDSMATWKHHYKDGKRLSLSQIYAHGAEHFHRAEQYAAAGITLMDNTPSEILDAATEMLDRMEGRHVSNPEDDARQEAFWKWYPRSLSPLNGIRLHGDIRLRIASSFLRQYG